ncbi:YjjG family noncanonical pyrimidine nucleotidase [Tamlana sp. 62-3]|uniref:YjjG family noncanonical pyrimidine nucleotidase n=1 Tax=Neotamlana sargassicola TaxID=2883125 RepID=A0A9X1I5N1_9FLAO|nr:YjjG family noncanonical pyrimidine nucleotidase [Tamlana sargassicola]MCB4807732.1 YjjG family noncanonical pyrimidine nucleotidase [Tamlana sargassicola]
MKLKGITDVFFDLDHTLWDFDKNSALTFQKIFKTNQITVSFDAFITEYVPINEHYWKLFREGKVEKEALRFGRLNDAFKAVNYSVEAKTIYKLSEDYITYLSSFNYLFENTFEILKYLQTHYTLHIITNGFDKVQQKKLVNSNIHNFFKTVTNSETVGVKKPDPKIFNYAMQIANCNGQQSVMIGDNFEADILGAQAVGMEAIYFNKADINQRNNLNRVNNLIELKQFL